MKQNKFQQFVEQRKFNELVYFIVPYITFGFYQFRKLQKNN